MIDFAGCAILLDIEGTTSSVSFVYDVMFPFVRRELDAYLAANWGSDDVAATADAIALDAGFSSLNEWAGDDATADSKQKLVRDEVIRLMDNDVKATGLKQLQGLVWKSGFESGEMQAHVYNDVPPALEAWRASDIDVRIYSSGSIAAQKLFFGHTVAGNLLDRFNGHYDTTTGPKKEPASYTAIASEFACDPAEILFLSDVVAELDAACTAGLQTGLSIRPGNADVTPDHGHREIHSFADVRIIGA